MANSTLTRFFGGSPGPVLLRLIVVSLVVGLILSALNLNPLDILNGFRNLIERIYELGFDAFNGALRYFFIGAIIVVPAWIIIRLLKMGRGEA
ncbi:MAG: integrase [Cohaesibacteraceae bacterium]|nr:integrase [Cohaesibacteraceae bacterium]MBL4874957.1 integrase [Cohaesibacteraceae bacterium]MBL4876085.1 integrase [Cohaesibacteraceae bacterium]